MFLRYKMMYKKRKEAITGRAASFPLTFRPNIQNYCSEYIIKMQVHC